MRWLDGIADLVDEFEQALGDTEGPGSLLSYSPWGCRVGYDLVPKQQQQMPGICVTRTKGK